MTKQDYQIEELALLARACMCEEFDNFDGQMIEWRFGSKGFASEKDFAYTIVFALAISKANCFERLKKTVPKAFHTGFNYYNHFIDNGFLREIFEIASIPIKL